MPYAFPPEAGAAPITAPGPAPAAPALVEPGAASLRDARIRKQRAGGAGAGGRELPPPRHSLSPVVATVLVIRRWKSTNKATGGKLASTSTISSLSGPKPCMVALAACSV